MQDQLDVLKGQQVEVVYNGLIYRGKLMGATEDEVSLLTVTDWVMLPMTGISDVRKAKPR